MAQTLTARRLLTALGSVEYPVVTIDDAGRIADISSDPAVPHANDTLTSTFFDIHIHGAVNHDVMESDYAAFLEINRFLAKSGVSHYLATTVTAGLDATLAALDRIASEIERTRTGAGEPLALPVGIHLEGPFLCQAKRGVHPADLLLNPDIRTFDRMQEAACGHIRLMTLAPELPGALELIAHAAKSGVKVSLGHTNATAAETRTAIEAGATSATHTFNAMRPLDHREPGVLGVTLDDDRLYAELICDGIHVAPELVRLWLRSKGEHRAMLVTDGISATGMPDGEYQLGPLAVMVHDGRATYEGALAGSVLTMDRAVANLQRFTGTSLSTAVRAAGHNPAAMLGCPEVLSVEPGAAANFNRFSASGEMAATYFHGRLL